MNMDDDSYGKMHFDRLMLLVRAVDPLLMISLMFLAYNTDYGQEFDVQDFIHPSGFLVGSGSVIDITSPVVKFDDGSEYCFPANSEFYKNNLKD